MAPTGRVQQGHYEVKNQCTSNTMQRSVMLQAVQHKLARLLYLLCAMLHLVGGQPSPGTALSAWAARLHADAKLHCLLPLQHPEFLESLGPVLEELKAKVDAPYDAKQLAQLLAQFLQFQEDALGIRVSANHPGCLAIALCKSNLKQCSAAARCPSGSCLMPDLLSCKAAAFMAWTG